MIRDFGRLFSAERQKEIAMAIFLNENITRREIDVLRTENVVNSVVDYIPLTTDFEGVDTQGADPRRAPWEGNEAADYRFAAEFTSRSVRRLAVVYARVGAKPLSYVPNRPWSIIMGRDVGFNIAYLQPNSRIYRSAWLEEWDKTPDKPWYGNLAVALQYNNTHFARERREKQIAVFEAKRSMSLVDMTNYENVYKIWQMIRDMNPRNDGLRYSFEQIFSLRKYTIKADGNPDAVRADIFSNDPGIIKMPDGTPIVRRTSILDYDEAFIYWFDITFPQYDGWCFLHKRGELRDAKNNLICEKISLLQGHHDEFYISRPYNTLRRLQYVIADMQ